MTTYVVGRHNLDRKRNISFKYRELLTSWRKSTARQWVSENVECFVISRKYRRLLGRKETGMLVRIGIKPVDFREVRLADLYMQMRSEWLTNCQNSDCQKVDPVVISDSYLVEFLRQYEKIGKKILEDKEFRATSFFKNWNAINEIGFRYDWYDYPNVMQKQYSPEVVKVKCVRFIQLFENIKSVAYGKSDYTSSQISVLKQPFENTRFGFDHKTLGYEIWGGHHRVASLVVLGLEKVDVVILEDIRGRELDK